MELRITAVGGGPGDLQSLREWLFGEEQLRGRVRLVESAPQPGTLGSLADALVVALPPGGAVALVSVLITWIRHRTRDAVYEITRSDGTSVKVSVKRARAMEMAGVQKLIVEVARSVEHGGGSGGQAEPGG